ncbi:MAG: M15 family metallopeptidase [Armatimonadota bacterium]|nr:M15 family metallopeptidase [Armatimonadota bacterium]
MPLRDGVIKPLSRRARDAGTPTHVGYWFGRQCDSGHLTVVRVPIIGRMYVHELVADAFVEVFRAIEAAGREDLIDMDDYGGTYNCRRVGHKPPPAPWSPHAWGIAVDLNVHHLARRDGSEYRSSRTNYYCQPWEIAPSLRQLNAFFAPWGFAWGGNWSSMKDPMHFEATELTVRKLRDEEVPVSVADWVVVLPGYEHAIRPLFHRDQHWVPVREIADATGYELIDRRKEQGKLYLRKEE